MTNINRKTDKYSDGNKKGGLAILPALLDTLVLNQVAVVADEARRSVRGYP